MANQDDASRTRESADPNGYLDLTKRPLPSLVFLLPLIVLYEIGLVLWAGNHDIVARNELRVVFSALGVTGAHLPGLIVVTVLLSWHVVGRHSWRLDGRMLATMYFESLAWAVPLVLLLVVLARHLPAIAAAAADGGASGGGGLDGHAWQAQLVFSVGAGIYEELVFRLFAIALLHFLLVDLIKMPERLGATAAVLVSSVAFALYHFSDRNPFDVQLFIQYTVAGVYFALLYLGRGFGIAVGVHAMYDVIVVSWDALR